MREELDTVKNLTLLEGSVSDLLITSPDSVFGNYQSSGKMQGIVLGKRLQPK
jgi:hypothetical protein